ncbi:Adaptor protein complex sigma subunit [Atractiella rhizophila]|nr:Adaptor protein complex sigma subunit [Atractiella rhizophila]
MIHSVLIFNNSGKPRMTKFYSVQSPSSPSDRLAFLNKVFDLVSSRSDNLCNFVELPSAISRPKNKGKKRAELTEAGSSMWSDERETVEREEREEELKVIYRHYATLYFAFVVDRGESELAILDLIQVFVESLDRIFANVSELDLIFHFPEIHLLLSCILSSGLVLDTSLESIVKTYGELMKARMGSNNISSDAGGFGGANAVVGGLEKLGWGFKGRS